MFKGTVIAGGSNLRIIAKCGHRVLFALLLMVGLGSAEARADGAFYRSTTAFANPQIPDQRALIHYENGVERLVIDTSFKGSGTNFAWVVPLPSVPKIEPVTAGFFPTLRFLFQPTIIHEPPMIFLMVFFIGYGVFTVMRAMQKKTDGLAIFALLCTLVFASSMLLPASQTAGTASTADGLEVLQRGRIGVYDTVTLSSTNGTSLLAWLSTNGFALPTSSLPVIQDYTKEGWIFVASKLHLEANSGKPLAAHPLSFTFKTDRPVYPLRMTGIDNKSCKIELYVFGTDQATASYFKVEQCEQPDYTPGEKHQSFRRSGFSIGHPGVAKWVSQSPVATKLSGELTSNDMKEDAYLRWIPYHHERLVRYSREGATITAANYVSVPFVILLLVHYWRTRNKSSLPHNWLCKPSSVITTCFICWLGISSALPMIPVTVSKFPRLQHLSTFSIMKSILLDRIEERDKAATNKPHPTLEYETLWLREQLKEASEARQELKPRWQTNTFTNMPWHEEDSPGNYTIRQESNDVVAVWYGSYGEEREFFRLSEARAKSSLPPLDQ